MVTKGTGRKMVKEDLYTYRVTWSTEDKEYVGLCAEFPSLSWLAATQEEALRGIREVVAESVADMKASGEPVPEPIAAKRYSGTLTIRITPEVHRLLAIQAAESKVSINRYICGKLTTAA
jgi:predicted HicB family RNase H-like nuclease